MTAPVPANALALDSLIAKTTKFRYPGEYIVRAPGDTIWVALPGREDSATALLVVRETHRLIRRVILQP